MSTYTITIVDAEYPWDMTATEKKEIAETITFTACDNEAAIEEAEDYSGDTENEWAEVILRKNGRKIWKNY